MLEYHINVVRLWAHEGHPYLALTGELWVSFLCYVEISDREMAGAFWFFWGGGVGVWCIIDISAGHVTPFGCLYSDHVTYWYRMDIDHWMLVQVETMCFQRETMTPDLSVWIHDTSSNASPDTPCVVLRRFVVPEIAQNCKWFCSLFEVIWLSTLGLFGRRVIVVTCVCPSLRMSVCLSVCSHHPC